MHGLRSALLATKTGETPAPPSTEEDCRRKGARDPGRPAADRVRDERRVAAQRGSPRHRDIVERATIVYGRKRSLVRVVNVSEGGVTVESAITPAVGETILVELAGADLVAGVVRWIRRGRIGLDLRESGVSIQTEGRSRA